MKIECILKRDGGTKVDLDGTQYHFKPQEDGSHTAEVSDIDHARRLLSIKEAYRSCGIADENSDEPEIKSESSPPETPVPTEQALGSASPESAELPKQDAPRKGQKKLPPVPKDED